jgi:hypothetical protein
MITETQPHMVVLQPTDALLAQLQPYLEGLDITATSHREQRLTMRSEVYDTLVARVGDVLDYDVRWQPNEHEPDGFVERVRPLELLGITHASVDWPQ